jgi:DNA-binding NarL/FixJ family response regulator
MLVPNGTKPLAVATSGAAVMRTSVTTSVRPLTVVIVDDHPVFADALALAIDTCEHLSCVGTAADIDRAISLVEETAPDAVVMDINLGTCDGITATRQLRARHPRTRVLILTGQHLDRSLALAALDAGASGLLPKGTRLSVVVDTIPALRDDIFAIDRGILPTLIGPTSTAAAPSQRGGSRKLTAREQQILEMLADGIDVQSAAVRLGLSPNTCRGYIKSLLTKLGAHSQLEALAIARSTGVLDKDR